MLPNVTKFVVILLFIFFTALESADTLFQPINLQQDILADIPQLKRSLYMLQNDLEKVKRMSSYHR